jgi:Restriction alleviation protein Lar
MIDLMNCPFCGGLASTERNIAYGPTGSPWVVGCDVDGCAEFAWFDTEAEAIAAWNRRAPVPLPVDAPEPTPGAIDLLCLSLQDVIAGRLETGDAAADLAAVKEHLDTALKLTGFDGGGE